MKNGRFRRRRRSLVSGLAPPPATLLPRFFLGADNAHRKDNRHGQRVLRSAGRVGADSRDIALRALQT